MPRNNDTGILLLLGLGALALSSSGAPSTSKSYAHIPANVPSSQFPTLTQRAEAKIRDAGLNPATFGAEGVIAEARAAGIPIGAQDYTAAFQSRISQQGLPEDVREQIKYAQVTIGTKFPDNQYYVVNKLGGVLGFSSNAVPSGVKTALTQIELGIISPTQTSKLRNWILSLQAPDNPYGYKLSPAFVDYLRRYTDVPLTLRM